MKNLISLVRNVRLIDGASSRSISSTKDVHIKNGVISRITDAAIGPVDKTADDVIDGTGKLMLTGLVNAHYHSHDVLAKGLFEDIPLEVWIALAIMPARPVSAREARLRTLIGAVDNLRNGVTTVQDMYGCGPGAEATIEAVLAAYEEVGIRCVMALQLGDRPAIDCLPGIRGHASQQVRSLLDPPQSSVEKNIALVNRFLANAPRERLHWAIGPGSPQRCTFELLKAMSDIATEEGLPLVTHVNESQLQVHLSRELYGEHGGSSLDYLQAAGAMNDRLCIAHGVWFNDAEIDRIAQARAAVATNPASNLKLKNGVAPIARLRKAGVRVGIGCDNVSAGDSQNLFEAMKLVCTLVAGSGSHDIALSLLASDAVEMATATGADVIGLKDVTGQIKAGFRADFSLLDLHDPAYVPLNDAARQIVFCESGRSVDTVVVDGKVLVRGKAMVSIDWTSVISEMEEISAAFLHDHAAHALRFKDAVPSIRTSVADARDKPLEIQRWIAANLS